MVVLWGKSWVQVQVHVCSMCSASQVATAKGHISPWKMAECKRGKQTCEQSLKASALKCHTIISVNTPLAKTSHLAEHNISGMGRWTVEDVGKDQGERENSEPIIHPTTIASSSRTLSVFYSLISVLIIFTAQNKINWSFLLFWENSIPWQK